MLMGLNALSFAFELMMSRYAFIVQMFMPNYTQSTLSLCSHSAV